MNIQSLPPRPLSKALGLRPQSNFLNPTDRFTPSSGDNRCRMEAGAFTALCLGGATALGHFYGGHGMAAAAGLAVLATNMLAPSNVDSDERFLASVATGLVAWGCAAGGHTMGLGFVAATTAFGGALGYVACRR